MPIQGRFYTSGELQKLLGVSKQRISNLARERRWEGPHSGLYYAEGVEWYLMGRGIDPATLEVQEYAPMAEYSPNDDDDDE